MLVIYSINANGLRDVNKIKSLFITCDIYKWDVLCLQETFWDDAFMNTVKKLWDGDIIYNNYELCNRKGVAIIVRKNCELKHRIITYGEKGRFLKLHFEHLEKSINIFSLYAPNEYSERKMFFKSCNSLINPKEINIIAGDFNDYLDVILDRSRNMSKNLPNNTSLLAFSRDNDLIDIWRNRNPDKRTFSRKQIIEGIVKQSRIDNIFTSRNCMPYVVNCFYKMSTISDHSYVCIKCDFSEMERGPGMWIFNNRFLNDDDFCRKIRDILSEALNCPLYRNEKLIWWDNLKYKFKTFAKHYSKKKYKEDQTAFWSIHNKLQNEYLRADKGLNVNQILIQELELELKNYEKKKCDGAILRSKAYWAIESDRNTSYFLKLEKHRQENNCVKALYTPEGNIVTDTFSILETEVDFYRKLYSEEQVDPNSQEVVFNTIKTKLDINQQASCDTAIDIEQLTKSLNEMSKNKSPGFDGLTVEFYKKFWNLLGPLFAEVVEEIEISKQLTKSMQKGIISLIYKKGDKKNLKNWRPITLLNVDYKIISKTLASRLKLVLENIVSTEQTSSVPGRDISENIASIRDIIDYAIEEDIPAYILKIDSEKAFDRISHDYLFKLLSHFGFGDNFIQWVKILYTHASSAVKCNGHISKFFDVDRSVRQGCGLSALLYVIAAEPLNSLIKQSSISGIQIKNTDTISLIYQHADDTTLTLADRHSVSKTFDVLNTFCKASGAKVNVEKSEVLVINDACTSLSGLHLPLTVKDNAIEILGIYLGLDKQICENMNWRRKINKIRNLLNIWKQRYLTLRGRAIVIQTLFLSRIWYILNVQPLPEWAANELKKLCREFLWANKPPQIKESTIIGKEAEGGLNIPDIQNKCYAFRLKWLRKYFDTSRDTIWKHTMSYFLSKYKNMGLTFEVFSILFEKSSLNTLPPIYQELLKAWDTVNEGERELSYKLPNIYHQPLFSNPHIVKENKMLFFRVFVESGITKISDIVKLRELVKFESIYTKILNMFPGYNKEKCEKLYTDITDALPQQWKDEIADNHCSKNELCELSIKDSYGDIIPTYLFTSKLCYTILKSRKYKLPASTTFIESFGLTLDKSFWKTVFTSSKNPEMIDLDFKIAHSIVWTKEKLYTAKITNSNTCPVCNEDIEDLLHMFIECDQLQSFHSFIIDILSYFYKDVGFTQNSFNMWLLFGMSESNELYQFINLLLSTARLAIYKRRNIKSMQNKLIECRVLFEVHMKQQLKYLHYYFKSEEMYKFQEQFINNNPYVRIDNQSIIVKWD